MDFGSSESKEGEKCPGIELDGHEVVVKFCYLGDTEGSSGFSWKCFSQNKEWMEINGALGGLLPLLIRVDFSLIVKYTIFLYV